MVTLNVFRVLLVYFIVLEARSIIKRSTVNLGEAIHKSSNNLKEYRSARAYLRVGDYSLLRSAVPRTAWTYKPRSSSEASIFPRH